MAKKTFDSVVCFACGDWWYHNHGHFDMQIMRRFAQRVPVLYVNAMGLRFPAVSEGCMFARRIRRKMASVARGLASVAPRFSVLSVFSVPLYHVNVVRRANAASVRAQIYRALQTLGLRKPAAWVVSPSAVDVVRNGRFAKCVYQRTDDFAAFPGVRSAVIHDMDREMVALAGAVVHVSRELHQQCTAAGGTSRLLDHGVDFERFAEALHDPWRPADMLPIPHPIVGFFGAMDSHTFDADLVERCADQSRHAHFVLVGAATVQTGGLRRRSNVHLLGQKPYEQIPHYGKAFDVAMMPWVQNDWIRRCKPVKLKEYLALGKPVVSMHFPAIHPYEHIVWVCRDKAEFVHAVDRSIQGAGQSAEDVHRRQECVAGDSWDRVAAEAWAVLRRA